MREGVSHIEGVLKRIGGAVVHACQDSHVADRADGKWRVHDVQGHSLSELRIVHQLQSRKAPSAQALRDAIM